MFNGFGYGCDYPAFGKYESISIPFIKDEKSNKIAKQTNIKALKYMCDRYSYSYLINSRVESNPSIMSFN